MNENLRKRLAYIHLSIPKEDFTMGSYEAELMKQLDEREEKMNRTRRTRKGLHPNGDGCYSSRGPYTDEEDEWN